MSSRISREARRIAVRDFIQNGKLRCQCNYPFHTNHIGTGCSTIVKRPRPHIRWGSDPHFLKQSDIIIVCTPCYVQIEDEYKK